MILRHVYATTCALMLFACSELGASTIISIGGSNDVAYVLGSTDDEVMVESWNSTDSYNSADISFVTDNLFSSSLGISGTAYLMSAIGPGATTADQIATTTFETNTPGISSVLLFSDLTLGPGTYYLVLTGSPVARPWITWEASNPQSGAVLTEDGATTWTGDYLATSMVGPIDRTYVPDSTFEYVGTGAAAFNLHFQVTGTVAPEPHLQILLACGFGLLALASSVKRRSRRKTSIQS